MQGGELNMRDVFIEGGGRRRQEERGLRGRSALQEEVLELTGGVITTPAAKQKLAAIFPPQQSAERCSVHLHLLKLCTIQQWLCLALRSNSVVPNP